MAKVKKANRNKNYYPILMLFAALFMSIGYASVSSVTLDINGEVVAKAQDGVFITDVKVLEEESSNAISINYTADEYILNSNISLEKGNSNSQLTYQITLYNSSDKDIPFYGCGYDKEEGSLFYTNSNIIFETSIKKGDVIAANSEKIITVTFKYKDVENLPENNNLFSYIKFGFSEELFVFDFTGDAQEFKAPINGTYKVELWGASSGVLGSDTSTDYPYGMNATGKGAYVSGKINLTRGTKLFVFVGGQGENGVENGQLINKANVGGYNGGGYSGYFNGDYYCMSGGGATDVRIINNVWNEFESLASRIIVAAGGGGAFKEKDSYIVGSAAGGLVGTNGTRNSSNPAYSTTGFFTFGGSQSAGGTGFFDEKLDVGKERNGLFGFAPQYTPRGYGGGGGGGYYAGATGFGYSGAGGSSFISGHDGCDAIEEYSTELKIVHTGQSVHYSGYKFTETKVIDGLGYSWTNVVGDTVVGMPTHNGDSTMIGNVGNGYAKITLISID